MSSTKLMGSVVLAAALLPLNQARAGEAPARRAGIYLASTVAASTGNGDPAPARLRGTIVQKIRQTGMLKTMLTGGHMQGDVIGTLEGARSATRLPSGRVSFRFQMSTGSGSAGSPDLSEMMASMSGDLFPPRPTARTSSSWCACNRRVTPGKAMSAATSEGVLLRRTRTRSRSRANLWRPGSSA